MALINFASTNMRRSKQIVSIIVLSVFGHATNAAAFLDLMSVGHKRNDTSSYKILPSRYRLYCLYPFDRKDTVQGKIPDD